MQLSATGRTGVADVVTAQTLRGPAVPGRAPVSLPDRSATLRDGLPVAASHAWPRAKGWAHTAEAQPPLPDQRGPQLEHSHGRTAGHLEPELEILFCRRQPLRWGSCPSRPRHLQAGLRAGFWTSNRKRHGLGAGPCEAHSLLGKKDANHIRSQLCYELQRTRT